MNMEKDSIILFFLLILYKLFNTSAKVSIFVRRFRCPKQIVCFWQSCDDREQTGHYRLNRLLQFTRAVNLSTPAGCSTSPPELG